MKLGKRSLSLAVALGLAMGVSGSVMAQAPVAADTVVYGTIYTSNAKQEVVKALAVKDGKYVYVGNKAGAKAYIGANTKVIDKKDGMIMAGSTEAHGHYMQQSVGKCLIPCHVDSLAALKAKVEAFMAKHPDKKVYCGGGWFRENDLAPNAEIDYVAYLDKICSDRPMLFTDCDAHQAIVNSKALEIIFKERGIKLVDKEKGREDTASLQGAIILRLPNGQANGYLRDQAVMLALRLLCGDAVTAEEYDKAMEDMQQTLYKQGYTNYNDALTNGTGKPLIEAMFKADAQNKMKVNIKPNYNILVYELQDKALLNSYLDNIAASNKLNSKHILPGGIKVFADGVTETQTGVNDVPYPGTNNYGNVVTNEKDIYELTKAANLRGISIHSHSYGNVAVNYTINAFVKAQNEVKNGTRNTMGHVRNVLPQDYKRMADNNIAVAENINWHQPLTAELRAKFSAYNQIPEELLDDGYPIKSLVDSGIVTASSTDAPSNNGFPTDAFGIMELAVNPKALSFFEGIQESQKKVFVEYGYTKENFKKAKMTNAYQCVPVKTAMDIMTINGAKFLEIDKERGSIEVGKYADFVLIDNNLLKCKLDEIHKTKVEKVFFEGELVYGK